MDTIYEFAKSAWVVWLVILFTAIVIAVWRPSRRAAHTAHAQIPLQDEDPPVRER